MSHAIELAQRGWGQTHPNPIVGAVVVKDGKIVGEGFHAQAGGPHAEVVALRAAGEATRGATLYVTLEPCSTHGRTPPCCDAIISAGIREVYIGATDPNPQHQGRGHAVLREAGVCVEAGILAPDCEDLNLIFNHWIQHRRPLIAAKIATTIDGLIAAHTGDSRWITGPAARADVHRWRRYFPAIGVGAGTVLTDNPSLTVRDFGDEEWCPVRFIFDRSLGTCLNPLPKVYSDAFASRTILVADADSPTELPPEFETNGVQVWRLPSGDVLAAAEAFLDRCNQAGITGVYFEGGGRLLSTLLVENQLDYIFAYRAPIILADSAGIPAFAGAYPDFIREGWRLHNVRHATFGDDQLIRGWLRK